MEELSKNFDHQQAEQQWYQRWLDKGYFHSEPDEREPYTIVIPPPNVTGVLHMGHCLNNTIQDILVRRARMQGKMPAGYQVPIMLPLLLKPKWCKCSVKKALPNPLFPAMNF